MSSLDCRRGHDSADGTRGVMRYRVVTGKFCLSLALLLLTLPVVVAAASQDVLGSRYADPKGYFKIVPPAGWKLQEYPADPRGKVAFTCPESGTVDLRVLVNTVDFSTIQELEQFCRDTEKRVGIPMKIERITFGGQPAIRRTFETKALRFLYTDFLVGKVDHNIAYGAPPGEYNKYLPVVLKSMETYEAIVRNVTDKDSVDHLAAKKLRLAQLMLEINRVDLALEYVREGLGIAPQHTGLLAVQKELQARFKREGDKPAPTAVNRYSSDAFGFSFALPEKVNVYTAGNPGPMAARINAITPMWIVSADRPLERINVKMDTEATLSGKSEEQHIMEYVREAASQMSAQVSSYVKVSIQPIKIGMRKDKAAVEHIHLLKLNPPKKLRQIVFRHNGKTFIFTCSTAVDRYDTANPQFFEQVFTSMEFK